MTQAGSIQYLKRSQVDSAKWDACINRAENGLIYAYSIYLDHMVGEWDALVLNDYEAVMPLPWRKKWGLAYLYQPALTAQLGIFGNGLSAAVASRFLQAVPKKFRYWDFSLNYQNLFLLTGFPLYERMNYVLPLHQQYEQLYKGYRENIRRNIKKSGDFGCTSTRDVSLGAIRELTKFSPAPLHQQDFESFATMFEKLQEKRMAATYGVRSKAGELLASAAFVFSHRRAYYIFVGNHPNGRTLGASHALVDAFIQDHAGSDLLLDFEGSDARNLAFFYASFGAQEEKYAAIKRNSLPWWVAWMK